MKRREEWGGVKRGRRHPRHNLISDLSIDLIERLWPATRQPKRRTTTSSSGGRALGNRRIFSPLEWSGRWFHSFAIPSIHLFRLLRLVLVSSSFSFFLPRVCCRPCPSIESIRCWINRSLISRLSQLYIRPAFCRAAVVADAHKNVFFFFCIKLPDERTRESHTSSFIFRLWRVIMLDEADKVI